MQMSKEEFLNGLQTALSGALPQGKILEHVNYYRSYIESQIRSGKSEEAVVAELGAPRLIAKTLLDTDDGNYQSVYEEERDIVYGKNEDHRKSYEKKHTYKLDFTTWYGKLIAIAAAIAFICLLIFIIGTVVPIIIIVCLVMYVISYFKKRR